MMTAGHKYLIQNELIIILKSHNLDVTPVRVLTQNLRLPPMRELQYLFTTCPS